jgi:excisionase family DNA binding protein
MSIPPPPKAGIKLRTIDETAEILCVSARTVRRLVSSGELTAHKFRRLVRISDSAIAAFLAANSNE